jgi:two-component system nitrogen regulation sensor histidine kinase NtrY
VGVLSALGLLRPRRSGSAAALITAAAKVGQGDLAVRVPAGERDELDALRVAFNEMVAELSLSRARVDYLQRLAAWQDFARRLAHEIKNPLTPIALAAQELARRYTGDDAGFRRTLETATEVIAEEVATLRRLVTAFSEFARMPEVKPAPGDLGEFVRDMAGSRAFVEEAGGGAAGVTVRFDAPATPLPVRIDRIMLRRAVDNLVRNAVQALRGRGGTVWVRAASHDVTEADGAVVPQAWLVVEDDGPGIPAAERDRVFEPYFTTKPEGTGLGLAIVRKVCLDHDGDVGLEARPGGGARFVLTLPRTTGGARLGAPS